MSYKNYCYFSLFLCFLGVACMRPQKTEFAILQLNDVYEIAPLENGKYAGLARVAQVRLDLINQNPKVFTLLAGDFVSPSLLGTLPDQTGTRIKGKQMVEVLNVLGLDYVTFGNHEFDIDSVSLQNRIDESTFEWISSNVRRSSGAFFSKNVNGKPEYFPRYVIDEVKQGNKNLRIGFLGVTLPFNEQPYVRYDDYWKATKEIIAEMRPKCEIIVAITHLDVADDQRLARENPEIDLIVGGHDHTNMKFVVGNTLLTKADANAKTVYIHRIQYDWKNKKTTIKPELKEINAKISHEPKTESVVQKWLSFSDQSLHKLGYDPKDVIYKTKELLDGHEASVRSRPTNLTKIITAAIAQAMPEAQGVIINGGSIRIDDMITGQITQQDILRTMPFGGSLALVSVKGEMLKQVLEIGTVKNIDTGGYLQLHNIERRNEQWFIGNEPIEDGKSYKIATSDFLIEGREQNLHFFHFPDVKAAPTIGNLKNDVRDVVIDYLRKQSKK